MKLTISKALIALVAASSVLAACGANNEEPSSGASPSGSAPASESAQASQEKVKLTIGSWRTEDTEAYAKIIAAFNQENPNIELEFKPTKNTEYNTTLNTALQSGSGPDIIQLRPYAAGAAIADAGFLEPLDGLAGMSSFDKDTLLAATGSDGKAYGVPIVFSAVQIFYNKKIFDDNGLTPPATWDELIKTADALKSKKITPFAFGSKDAWILSLTQGAIGPAAYGKDFVGKILSGEANFKSPEFVSSIQAMKDLTPYFPDNYVGLGMDDMRNLFVTEQAAMMIMGDWEYAVMKKANPDLVMDVFPIPSMQAGGQPSVTTWVDGSYAVNAKSEHKAEALKFMEFLTSKTFGELAVNELSKPSTISGIQAADPLVAKISQNADTISTPYAAVVYFNKGNPTTKATLENALQGMYLDKLDPARVGEEVQKNADTWFTPKK